MGEDFGKHREDKGLYPACVCVCYLLANSITWTLNLKGGKISEGTAEKRKDGMNGW